MNNFCFQRDKMIVSDDNGVYAVSSVFQSQDQLIAYSSLSGRELWSFRFSFRKIVSLSIGSKGVFVLSKSNSMNRCYVTCLDLATGREIWENNFRDL